MHWFGNNIMMHWNLQNSAKANVNDKVHRSTSGLRDICVTLLRRDNIKIAKPRLVVMTVGPFSYNLHLVKLE